MSRLHRRPRASLALLLVLVLASTGCVSTRPLRLSPQPDPDAVAYINGHPEMHPMSRVVTRTDTIRAIGLEIADDQLLVRGWDRELVGSYRLEDVRQIDLMDRKGGFLRAMAASVGIAAGAGLLGAALASPDGPDDRSRTETGLRVGAITGVFVLPVGFVLGVSGSHVIRFQVEAAPNR